MNEKNTITAKTIGTPQGGLFDNPWPPDFPAVGQRVAIFAYEVTKVDGESIGDIRTFHIGLAETASSGPIGTEHELPQGVAAAWRGCGTGTVVRVSDSTQRERTCEVTPEDAGLL
ncbi:hypothetical protein [Amycolatopsis sp. lyj-90]|uniref:hypothetical protein n=1 Tax=Amycolatopsis sp. lyj-90 TaxID=2789285 RepID=UPI00397B9E4E